MKSKAFMIHWNALEAEEHAKQLRWGEWNVEIESEDGDSRLRTHQGIPARCRCDLPEAFTVSRAGDR